MANDYDHIPRFDGEDHWKHLSPQQQARIGAAALELAATDCGAVWFALLDAVDEAIDLKAMFATDGAREWPLPSSMPRDTCRQCVEGARGDCQLGPPGDRDCRSCPISKLN